jgi:hypothetical protein
VQTTYPISETIIECYQRDGAELIKGLFRDWVETLRSGVAENMLRPGPYASENLHASDNGRFLTIIATGPTLKALKTCCEDHTSPRLLPI